MYTLENLTKDHFGPLSELVLGLWPDCDITDEREFWNEVLLSSDHYFALAKDEDKYIGFINISIRTDYVEGIDSDKAPYLEAIFVKAEYRCKKVASLLLESGERWVKEKGFTQLASDTEINNLLSQDFHIKSGFNVVNTIVCFVKDF
jgi:aminoglycoside 6'-N-acetyltransferase I